MDKNEEIALLKDECLKKDGKPRKNCDLEKLRRLIELQAEKPDAPLVENAPDNVAELQVEYDKLVKKLFDTSGDEIKLKKGATAKDMARFNELKDMIRQPVPSIERIKTKVIGDKIQVRVSKGAPVTLEGKIEKDWKTIAQIMPQGGILNLPNKYTSFRIKRGTDKPQFIELKKSSPVPRNKITKKDKQKIEI